ncbi:hypothetical protein K439DRAFT_1621960 [Ramaria rubella]|nr:hypothetical protein K439DRAFT_1621960 [Ramaria rubella]
MSPQIPPPPPREFHTYPVLPSLTLVSRASPSPPAAFSTRLPHPPRSSGRPHTYPVSHRLLPHPTCVPRLPRSSRRSPRLPHLLGPPSVHPCHTRLPRFSHRPRAPPTILPPPPRICLVSSGPPVALTYHPAPRISPDPSAALPLYHVSPGSPALPRFFPPPSEVSRVSPVFPPPRGLPCLPRFSADPTCLPRSSRASAPLHVFLTSSDPPVALTYHPGSSHRPTHLPRPTRRSHLSTVPTSPVSPAVVTGLPHLPLFSR